MKSVIQNILKNQVVKYLEKHKPKIIAITGSNGKTSTREAIYTVLKSKYTVRRSEKNYNTEIGVPLSALGVEAPRNIFCWPKVLMKAWQVANHSKHSPEVLILEMAADKPGDLKYLTGFITPNISVVTTIGELPVHVEAFSGPKAVADEKSNIVKTLEENGVAILNHDDKFVLDMRDKTKGHVFTFGFNKGSDIHALEEKNAFCDPDDEKDFCGVSFKTDFDGKVVPVKLKNVYGRPPIYAALAAFAVGKAMGMNMIEIAEAIKEYTPPKGRTNLIKGAHGSVIIDDTYNASPIATLSALDILRDFPAKRKIAVLGDMKELGRYSKQAHEIAGKEAGKIADLIFVVGEQAKLISESAIDEGFKKENVYEFMHAIDAGRSLRGLIEEGDLVLVKGSQSMRMELVIEEIMADPNKKKKLLVRQDWPWRDKKGHPRLI